MARARINENGELVNSETGEVIGNKSGNTININSSGSEMKTLDDFGVRLPDFPEEEETDGDEDEDFAHAKNIPVYASSAKQEKAADGVAFIANHADAGPTSFKRKKTKYEISGDSYFVIKFGLFQKEDGRFIPLKEEAVENIPSSEMHWVKFRMWNYSEELNWKSEFLEYNSATKSQFLNIDKLNERKIRCLMLDWSFGEYDDGLKLLHCDGRLSDESYAVFIGLYPSIANTIVDLMNLVLESNQ